MVGKGEFPLPLPRKIGPLLDELNSKAAKSIADALGMLMWGGSLICNTVFDGFSFLVVILQGSLSASGNVPSFLLYVYFSPF